MHSTIFAAFDAICRTRLPSAARILEVGSVAEADSLLNLPALNDVSLRVGVNLHFNRRSDRHAFVQVAADGLAAFADDSFDAVLCNSVLEHDAYFWRTLVGIHRVARSGALIVIGVPGYAEMPPPPFLRLARGFARLPGLVRLMDSAAPGWASATPTLAVHNYPGDYYRFSAQAMRKVLLAGCRDVEVTVEMSPPRIIGFGWRSVVDGSAK